MSPSNQTRNLIMCRCGCIAGINYHIIRWDQYGFHKKRIGFHYAELEFLHPVGPVGHVVHFGASWTPNVDALFFMLRWDWYGFHKKRVKTHYAELVFCIWWDLPVMQCILVDPEHKTSTHTISCSGRPGMETTESTLGHVTPNL
jgi:hypothetical protein